MKRKVGISFSVFCLLVFIAIMARVWSMHTITINWNTTYQMIDGFGASATGYTGVFTADQADQFFSPASGLGLSILRIEVIPSTLESDCGCVANNVPAKCILAKKSQIVSGDLQVAQLAATRGLKIVAVPWSPPAQMKSSGQFCSSGAMVGTQDNYAAYSSDLASFPTLLHDHGVSLDAMSVQNEPDVANPDYNTSNWSGQQIHDFVPYFAKALKDAGYGNIKIALPEESEWSFELMKESMGDPSVARDVGIVFGHAYPGKGPPSLPAVGDRHVWQTEVSSLNHYDGSMRDAVRWARSINEYMNIGANAWMFWSLDCGRNFFNHDTNMCLTDQNSRLAKRAYVLGQYAKFVRPGWQRMGVTNNGALLVTAYKGPEKKFAVVVVNPSRFPVVNQKFVFNGVSATKKPIIPWLTSNSYSLAAQTPISLQSGISLTYTIPGRSVITFQDEGD